MQNLPPTNPGDELAIIAAVREEFVNADATGTPVENYAKNIRANIMRGNGLFITGDVGVGKTYTACACVIAAIREGCSAKYLTGGQIIRQMIGAITAGSSEEAVLNKITRTSLLVVDDLGREGTTAKTLSRLFDVINERTSRKKATIYTTNYTPAELVKQWSETGDRKTAQAIVSRIAGSTKKIEMYGDDRRLG